MSGTHQSSMPDGNRTGSRYYLVSCVVFFLQMPELIWGFISNKPNGAADNGPGNELPSGWNRGCLRGVWGIFKVARFLAHSRKRLRYDSAEPSLLSN